MYNKTYQTSVKEQGAIIVTITTTVIMITIKGSICARELAPTEGPTKLFFFSFLVRNLLLLGHIKEVVTFHVSLVVLCTTPQKKHNPHQKKKTKSKQIIKQYKAKQKTCIPLSQNYITPHHCHYIYNSYSTMQIKLQFRQTKMLLVCLKYHFVLPNCLSL